MFFLFLLLTPVMSQPAPAVEILPNGFQFQNEIPEAFTIIFNVTLNEPIICSDPSACLVEVELSSIDPRVKGTIVVWNASSGDTFNDAKQFTLNYLPEEHCKSNFSGSGTNVMSTYVTSGSELYQGYAPSFIVTLPPTSETSCSTPISALAVILIVAGSLGVVAAGWIYFKRPIPSVLKQFVPTIVPPAAEKPVEKYSDNLDF